MPEIIKHKLCAVSLRKIVFVVAFILCSSFFIPSIADAGVIRRAPNNLSLVGHWSFDDGAGTKATDSSGNGYTGSVSSATWTNGRRGKALQFDSTDSVYIDQTILASADTFTFAFWMYADSQSGYLFEFAQAGSTNGPLAGYSGSDFRLDFGMSSDAGKTSTTVPTAGVWHHVALVRSGSTASFYLDGALDKSFTGLVSTVPATNYPCIGSRSASGTGACGGAGSTFQGKIDDFRVYSRALTLAQILVLYNSGQATQRVSDNRSLTGYWNFDDASGTKVGDVSGNGNVGSITGSPTWVSGKIGKALSFGGSSDYVKRSGFQVGNTQQRTFSMWFKPTSLSADQYLATITNDANNYKWQYMYLNTTGVLYFMFGDNSFYNERGYTSNPIVTSTGLWYHIVYVVDVTQSAGSRVKVYVNGVSQALGFDNDSGNAVYDGSDMNIYFGVINYGTLAGYMNGTLDDFRAYSRALTASEVLALYKVGGTTLSASQNSKYTDGLIGNWSFNGPDVVNGVVKDRSGGGNDANAFSIATSSFYSIGKLGQGATFDGTDDYLNVTNTNLISSLSGQKISVFAWVKPNLVVKNNLLSFQGNPNFFIHEGRTPYFRELAYWDSTVGWKHGNTALTMGDWTHIGYTLDGTALTFYVNGVADGTATTATFNMTGYTTIRIGLSNGAEYGSGGVDEMRVYNRILSASEAKQLYDLGR